MSGAGDSGVADMTVTPVDDGVLTLVGSVRVACGIVGPGGAAALAGAGSFRFLVETRKGGAELR